MEQQRPSPNTSERIPTGADADADAVRSTPKVPKGIHFSEIKLYLFVGIIGILIATVFFFVWSLCSNLWFHSVGLYLDPNRYRAVPMPNYAVVITMVVAIGCYIAHNFMAAPPPTSLKSVFDECSEELLGITPSGDDYQLLQHLPDLDITAPDH